MAKARIFSVILILVAVSLGYFSYTTENPDSRFKFKLGLDLQGGSQLVYKANVSSLGGADIDESMESLRDVIERRVNLFGVSEPVVQVEEGRGLEGEIEHRLLVELPGVTDLDQAIELIGATPLLEFKLVGAVGTEGVEYVDTGLTGRYIKTARLEFDPTTGTPFVGLDFTDEGGELFAKITRENTGRFLAIFLDGVSISEPVIQEEISAGKAVISGQFTPTEARVLVGRLNAGALPVAIELISTEHIGATLGADALNRSLRAGWIGLLAAALFMILWYRVPGIISVLALVFYAVLLIAVFKLFGVTLTTAGIAGLVISLGMAFDANVIIFERLKEELRSEKPIGMIIEDSFARSWPSIKDANMTSILSAVVLFWFGTSLIKGFALAFGIGVLISMFSAITVTRTFLLALGLKSRGRMIDFFMRSGFSK